MIIRLQIMIKKENEVYLQQVFLCLTAKVLTSCLVFPIFLPGSSFRSHCEIMVNVLLVFFPR